MSICESHMFAHTCASHRDTQTCKHTHTGTRCLREPHGPFYYAKIKKENDVSDPVSSPLQTSRACPSVLEFSTSRTMNNKFVLFIRIQLRAVCYRGLQGLRHTLFHSELPVSLALANEMFTTAVGTGESVLVAVLFPLPRLCICSSHHEEKKKPIEPAGG